MKRLLLLGSLAFAALSSTACDEEDKGSAPKISGLELSPTTVEVGATANVTATFAFVAEDADASEVEIVLTAGGQSVELSTEIMGAEGQSEGQASVLLVVQAAVTGDVGVELTVVDTDGQRSNTLEGTLDAVAARHCAGDCGVPLQLGAWLPG